MTKNKKNRKNGIRTSMSKLFGEMDKFEAGELDIWKPSAKTEHDTVWDGESVDEHKNVDS